MHIQTIAWRNDSAKLIDQTLLPNVLRYVCVRDARMMFHAIKTLQVRGAPALGAAASLGVYLGIRNSRANSFAVFSGELDKACAYIASSRPTARNLFWGIERVRRRAFLNKDKPVNLIKEAILKEALSIIEEDKVICRRIGRYGNALIRRKDVILTICNTGILATIDYGTALGVVYCAQEHGKQVQVYSCETRPILQGARLTTWELAQKKVPVTMICDSMAASVLKQGRIDKVMVGADRIAANGDTANKIGTYSLAVLAHFHKVPFYVAAPLSTFDVSIKDGGRIPIEERQAKELTDLYFKKPIAAAGINHFNPAFDVTPHQLISGIITEAGVIRKPFEKNIRKAMKGTK